MSITSAIQNAASGARVAERIMDVVANGFAKLQVTGGKIDWVEAGSLGSQTVQTPGAPTEEGATSVGAQVGLGVTVKAVHHDMSQGALEDSDSPLHMAIQGSGFFQYIKPDGRVVYSRNGTCRLDSNRNIVNSDGYILAPGIQIPADAEDFNISNDGKVSVKMPGQLELQDAGQIELARFSEPRVLGEEGGYYIANTESGDPQVGAPDSEGRGIVRSRYLEACNGSAIKLMGDMIKAQRNHSQCLAIIKKADEMSDAQTRVVS